MKKGLFEPGDDDRTLLETALAALRGIANRQGNTTEGRQARRALAATESRGKGLFVKIWDDRAEEIHSALDVELHGNRHASALWVQKVLYEACRTMTPASPRMGISVAELAAAMRADAKRMSIAFKALAKVGVVMLPLPSGKSRTWEIDATYASKMQETARQLVILRQEAGKATDDKTPALRYRDHGEIDDTPSPITGRYESAKQDDMDL